MRLFIFLSHTGEAAKKLQIVLYFRNRIPIFTNDELKDSSSVGLFSEIFFFFFSSFIKDSGFSREVNEQHGSSKH